MFKAYKEYYKNNPQGYWFKAKLYGWGWMPVRWQGWLVLALYLGSLTVFSLYLNAKPSPDTLINFWLFTAALTGILILICFAKGEKPRWQWGPPKKHE